MKLEKNIVPSYNEKKQVMRCVKSMFKNEHKIEEFDAKLMFIVGFNGKIFVSSTDWVIQSPYGACILPPTIVPQYQTFVKLEANMQIDVNKEDWQFGKDHQVRTLEMPWTMTRDGKFSEVIFPDGTTYRFYEEEALMIELTEEMDRFILSDCDIEFHDKLEKRQYVIKASENTQYGCFENGKIALTKG